MTSASRRDSLGSSPLTRGKPYAPTSWWAGERLIPAHAGKTHVCPAYGHGRRGSSPLTRGKRCGGVHLRIREGLIPAHAGKTGAGHEFHERCEAHPRSRGENQFRVGRLHGARGSSPLTRGKPSSHPTALTPSRLIPAHAGKTTVHISVPPAFRAHPRSRGENAFGGAGCSFDHGSSPLTRGKPGICVFSVIFPGLIPAHAGKTVPDSLDRRHCRAHPRSRGENWRCSSLQRRWAGSSPLTRGKRGDGLTKPFAIRLIPAHAGKTIDA